jgi:hypothetical protein
MEQRDKLTVEECKVLLGADAEGWPDEKIERLRDRLEGLANELYGEIGKRAAEDLPGLREAAYAHRHGLDKTDLIVDPDFDNEDDEDTAEDGPCPPVQ